MMDTDRIVRVLGDIEKHLSGEQKIKGKDLLWLADIGMAPIEEMRVEFSEMKSESGKLMVTLQCRYMIHGIPVYIGWKIDPAEVVRVGGPQAMFNLDTMKSFGFSKDGPLMNVAGLAFLNGMTNNTSLGIWKAAGNDEAN